MAADPVMPSPPPANADVAQQLAALRAQGAAQRDPLQLHYLEALARRAQTQAGPVQGILQGRLAQGLERLRTRCAQALAEPQQAAQGGNGLGAGVGVGTGTSMFSSPGSSSVVASAPEAQPLPATLAGLVAALAQAPQGLAAAAQLAADASDPAQPELKSVRYFRATWSQLSSERQLAQALDQAPRNAGPINSHMLVLRSLALMRTLSPAYLNRFMCYADTLLSLDQDAVDKQPVTTKPGAEAGAGKKPSKKARAAAPRAGKRG